MQRFQPTILVCLDSLMTNPMKDLWHNEIPNASVSNSASSDSPRQHGLMEQLYLEPERSCSDLSGWNKLSNRYEWSLEHDDAEHGRFIHWNLQLERLHGQRRLVRVYTDPSPLRGFFGERHIQNLGL